jgi:hypothetical protein
VVLAQLRRPRREVVAGGLLGRAFVATHIVAPRLAERILAIDVDRSLRAEGTAVPPTSGSLHAPGAAPAAVDGGWHGQRRERRRRTAALAGLVAATAGVLAIPGYHHTVRAARRALDGRRTA